MRKKAMLRYGDIIREKRELLRLTMAELAGKTGTHKGYLSGIESGKVAPPSPALTARLCRALDLPQDEMQIRAWTEKAPACVREKVRLRFWGGGGDHS